MIPKQKRIKNLTKKKKAEIKVKIKVVRRLKENVYKLSIVLMKKLTVKKKVNIKHAKNTFIK